MRESHRLYVLITPKSRYLPKDRFMVCFSIPGGLCVYQTRAEAQRACKERNDAWMASHLGAKPQRWRVARFLWDGKI